MIYKDRITNIFWAFLFIVILLQFVSYKINLTTGMLCATAIVFTYQLYMHILTLPVVNIVFSGSNSLLQIVLKGCIIFLVSLILFLECYFILSLGMNENEGNEILSEGMFGFISLFALTVIISSVEFLYKVYTVLIGNNGKVKILALRVLGRQVGCGFTSDIFNNIQVLLKGNKTEAVVKLKRYRRVLDYYVYDTKKKYIPIQQEVSFLKDYLEIENDKRSVGLKVLTDWEIPPSHFEIVPFILFPLIENAIKHAMPSKDFDFCIMQTCKVSKEGELFFEIKNTCGEKTLDISSKGLGLMLVRERLSVSYPLKHQLNIMNQPHLFSVRLYLDLSSSSEQFVNRLC